MEEKSGKYVVYIHLYVKTENIFFSDFTYRPEIENHREKTNGTLKTR